jgi:hypothetical protein
MKLLLFIVLLITNIICADDCTSLSTENTCKETSGCKWKAATCSGDNTCTSKTASQSECTGTSYTEQLSCTYTAASAATCTGNDVCLTVTNLVDNSACLEKKFGGTQCTYTAGEEGADGTCGPNGKTECEAVTALTDATACESTYYEQTPCTYTAAGTTTPASCKKSDGTDCSGVSDLTSSTACDSATYEGTSKYCVYAAGSCIADTTQETEETEDTEETEENEDTENPGKTDTSGSTNNGGDTSNTEKDNSGYIKFSLLFSLLYLLF